MRPQSRQTHPATNTKIKELMGVVEVTCRNKGRDGDHWGSDQTMDLRLLGVDVVKIYFMTKPNPSAPVWQRLVLKNPAWLRTRQIALYYLFYGLVQSFR